VLEDRNLRLDLLALGLLALTIFLTAALLSYDPADPPSTLVYPPHGETLNACGRFGALVSRWTFEALGLGAYYLLISLAVLDVVLLSRRSVSQPGLRTAGWLLSLVGVCIFAAMALPQLAPGPVIGSGGFLGAAGRGLLEANFATVGAYILTLRLILSGLLLCTDYVLLRLSALVVGKPVKGLGRGVARMGAAYTEKLAARKPRAAADTGDVDEEYEEEDEEDEPVEETTGVAVRMPGRAVEDESDEEAEEGAEDGGTDAAEEESAARSARKSLAGLLRIKKPHKSEREEVLDELEGADVSDEPLDYELPSVDLLLEGESFNFEEHEKDVRRKAGVLEKTFADFGFNVRVVEIQTGPVIAQFEVELEAGLRLSKITALADDLAIALRVPSVRIVAPIPGKNTVGIEVPNTERHVVRLREVMEEANGRATKMRIPLYVGKDVAGNPMVVDLATLPHLLIAGRTGTGKSVCLNSIIVSLLMMRRPDEVRLLLIDPKMVELSPYKCLPHLMHPVVTDMRKAEAILAWAVDKMEERYQLLARAGVRHISSYNQLSEEELRRRMQIEDDDEWRQVPTQLPFLVIVADEMADLMMTAAKEVEAHIIRLAQKSRAVGIHLVLATQKPTVDVITGLIKSNLPARISFQVASRTDSRVVLDEMGAEKLLGNGDLLFLWPGTSTLIRGQGTYLSDDEISEVIAAVATTEPQFVKELVQLKTDEGEGEGPTLSNRDDLYEAAVDMVVREGRGSVSLLQRALGIGYGRAARLIDYMAEDGIVGPYNGSQAREVTLSIEDWEAMQGQGTAGPRKVAATAAIPPVPVKEPPPPKPTPKPRRSNKILLAPPADERFDDEDEEYEEDVESEEGLEEDEEYEEGHDDETDEGDADDEWEDEEEGYEEEEEEDWDEDGSDEEYDEEEDDEWEEDEEEDYEDEYEEDEEEAPWTAESA